MRSLALTLLPGSLAVCRLGPDEPVPGWAWGGPLAAVVRTAEELSVVCAEAAVPEGVRCERGWRVLQQRSDEGEVFEAEVTGYNKGGLLMNVEGVNAFVPLSQVVGVRPEGPEGDINEASLAQMTGRKLRVKVIELNRRRNRVILSERAAMQAKHDRQDRCHDDREADHQPGHNRPDRTGRPP